MNTERRRRTYDITPATMTGTRLAYGLRYDGDWLDRAAERSIDAPDWIANGSTDNDTDDRWLTTIIMSGTPRQ